MVLRILHSNKPGVDCLGYSDIETPISELKNMVKNFNTARNWEQFHTPREVAVSISIEAAELLELFQWRSLSTSDVRMDTTMIGKIGEEMADIMIYIFSLSNTLNIDISSAVVSKLEKNALKYPEKSQKS